MRCFKQFSHDERINAGFGSDMVGYWKKLDLYCYMHYIDDTNGYYKYYSLTKDQYEAIKSGQLAVVESEEERFAIVRRYIDDNKMVFSDSLRGYDIDRSFLISHRNAISEEDTYLYEDKMIYMHICWEGKHYAAIPLPHMFNPIRKKEGISQYFYMHDGEKIPICYGKRIGHIEEG